MISESLIPPIINGILLGGLYAVIGLGLSLVFGVMKMVNLAHGAFVIFGSYMGLVLLTVLGLDPIIAIVLIAPTLFVVGYIAQKFLINRAYRLGAEPSLLITYGISIILANLFQQIFSPYFKSLVTPYAIEGLKIGPYSIPLIYVLDFIASFIAMLVLHWLLNRTYVGLSIRCASQDPVAAKLMGMRIDHVYALTLGISLFFASIAGVFLGLTFPFNPASSFTYLFIAFGVVVIGGLGSMAGTFIGGIVLGLSQTLGSYFLGVGLQTFAGFIVIFIMLAIRPQGIFGVKE
ncbi:branched-chain amino acid ABC transporter permease [Candidatus Bathyarchaeota archaeon]|nr:branched-chain amino acid ABC transporter permease [Candidatus Bathyarchaeota archaeon]